MNLEEIQKLIRLIEKSELSRFRLKKGDFELLLEKGSNVPVPTSFPTQQMQQVNPVVAQSAQENKAAVEKTSGVFIKAPMIGTYYSSPSPDQPPYV